ncbi:hypothetical protein V6Z11_D11G120200 [Gossypium hirsutum]
MLVFLVCLYMQMHGLTVWVRMWDENSPSPTLSVETDPMDPSFLLAHFLNVYPSKELDLVSRDCCCNLEILEEEPLSLVYLI